MSKQKSIELSVEVYRLVKKLPAQEEHVLTENLKLAAIDLSTNISKSELDAPRDEQIKFLSVARGKVAVVETLLLICVKLNYLQETEIDPALNLCAEVSKMLNATIQKLS